MKSWAIPFLYWLLKHLPTSIALLPVRLIMVILRGLYWWRKNPFRIACEYVCELSYRNGVQQQPKQVYRQFFCNALGTIQNYFQLYRDGIDSVFQYITIADNDADMMNKLLREHGGVVLMVPHNFASAFSALRMNMAFPLLVITRNSATIARTKIALEVFERMEISILMVRGGNPFELSRTLFSVLKSGKAVAATVDSVYHSDLAVRIEMFGQQLGFNPWAAKIAARKRLPVVPSYYRSNGRKVGVVFGKPIITDNIKKIIQHYSTSFEQWILEDPASWAFLGDKHWCRVLKKAVSTK